jgi:hypothetical protein
MGWIIVGTFVAYVVFMFLITPDENPKEKKPFDYNSIP